MFQPEEYEYLLHEIKNYICVISGSLHLITKQHPVVREYRHWDEILSDTEHLSQMCREISISNLHASIRLQAVDLAEFFCSLENEIAGLLAADRSQNASICFSMDIPESLPKADMDPIQINHALINLIKNASEAISDTGNITLSASVNDKHLCILVQDNGCGINPDQLNKIFFPAYTTKSSGTGIGLFITRKIIEAHGGKISCQSECGKGTAFTLLLPIQHPKKELLSS